MGKRGPKKTPTAALKLRGSRAGDDRGDEFRPASGIPLPTVEFADGSVAAREWELLADELDRLGMLTIVDGPALTAWCLAVQELADADAIIAASGLVLEGRDGNVVANPACLRRDRATEKIAKLSARFGFTPSDRVDLVPGVPKKSETEKGRDAFLGAISG